MSASTALVVVVLVGVVALITLFGPELLLSPRRLLRNANLHRSPSLERAVPVDVQLLEECGRLAKQGHAAPMGGSGSRSLTLPNGTTAAASTEYGGNRVDGQSTEGYLLAADDAGQRLVAAVCQGNEKHTRSMVAGALALATLHAHLCGTKRTLDLKADLLAAMTEAHSRIFRVSSAVATGLRGIGASVTVVAIEGTQLAAAHVGEGAAFLRRNGHVERLTASHAGVDAAEAREALRAQPDLAELLQWMVWKVMGLTERPSFDLFARDIEPGDLVVLATSLPALAAPQVLSEARGPADAVSAMLRAATPLAETPNIATSVVIRR